MSQSKECLCILKTARSHRDSADERTCFLSFFMPHEETTCLCFFSEHLAFVAAPPSEPEAALSPTEVNRIKGINAKRLKSRLDLHRICPPNWALLHATQVSDCTLLFVSEQADVLLSISRSSPAYCGFSCGQKPQG